ncbi:CoA transferase [Aquisalimonas sp.]|uniref:CaiB/BaiF CoA transferase family protein n=1 Tax=Aquisalimonas sp. TaxID=1872621 RepID=UPI0025B7BB99|nr:CoA transferase [Aquisalimonas sp.]
MDVTAQAEAAPLDGIRVLDLSRVLAGPWSTQCLADLGAEVLKIENSGLGDETRAWGPPYMDGHAAYYTCANRSKASLCLDLRDSGDLERLRALIAEADALVENFRLGTMERFGLHYERLAELNPGLVYCAISGYGRTGPNAKRPGYDYIIQAESGLMSVTGFPDGPPTKVGVAVSDLFAGLYATQSILAALFQRQKTGRGQFLDVALFDCQLAALANVAANALATGEAPRRYGNGHPNVVPYEVVEASDGPFVLAIGNDRQFRVLCTEVLQAPEMAEDPEFCRNSERAVARERLMAELHPRFAAKPRAHWISTLGDHGLPAGELRTVDEALGSEQTRHHGLVRTLPGDEEPVQLVGYPVRMSGAGVDEPGLPPRLGEGGVALAQHWLDHSRGTP